MSTASLDQRQQQLHNQQEYEDMKFPFNKVLIIGLGQLGLLVAKYVKKRGFDVYGYDISTKPIDSAEKIAATKQAIDFGSEDFVFIITVSTHQPDNIFSPQIDGLFSTINKISKEAKKEGALVSIESTIPKGTSKKVFQLLNHRLRVVLHHIDGMLQKTSMDKSTTCYWRSV